MENITCPHCQQASITPKQKWLATKWKDIYCPSCGGRSCIHPIGLALMYFVLTWDILFFGFMAVYESSLIYLGVLLAGWGILEFFSYYIPLVRLRPKAVKQ